MIKIASLATLSLCAALLVSTARATPGSTAMRAAPADAASAQVLQPVAFGDVPETGRRRGRPARKEKSKPYVPLSKDPAKESDEAHKAYLKRYGF